VSYDLSFHAREGAPPLTETAFVGHFADRPGYRAPGEYANEDTGVYFTFAYVDEEGATFEINFHRPHVFALEAEPEIASFVESFHLLVEDPQIDGAGFGDFSREAFLRGWNHGNRFALHASASERQRPPTLPSAEIERCWRWNLQRRDLQDRLGDDVFVPKIMFGQKDARVVTVCAWPDAIPLALPFVDLIAVARRALAPRSFFRGLRPDTSFVPRSTFDRVLDKLPCIELDAQSRYVDVSSPSAALEELVRKMRAGDPALEMLSVDEILDAEPVDAARSAGPR